MNRVPGYLGGPSVEIEKFSTHVKKFFKKIGRYLKCQK